MGKWRRLFLSLLLLSSLLNAKTLDLQQGVNGYSGCVDSYYDSHWPADQHGNSKTITSGSMAYLST